MAKKSEKGCDFNFEVRKLKNEPPERVYLLYGPEDYLVEHYLSTLTDTCLPDGDDGFSYKRFDGPELDPKDIAGAMDMIPFLSERSLIEVRNVDINRVSEPEKLIAVLGSVPSYCTVVFVQDAVYVPDARTKLVKFLKEKSTALFFDAQEQPSLLKWITRRFAAQGKSIDNDTAEHLVLVSGNLMNRLIPEINKVASYAKGERVTKIDVDAVAIRVPEANVFDMINLISDKKFDSALHILADLLKDKENSAFSLLALLSGQLRKLYIIRKGTDCRASRKELADITGIKYDFLMDRTMASAKKFTTAQLEQAVEDCVMTEYRLKSSTVDETGELKGLIMRLILGDSHGKA